MAPCKGCFSPLLRVWFRREHVYSHNNGGGGICQVPGCFLSSHKLGQRCFIISHLATFGSPTPHYKMIHLAGVDICCWGNLVCTQPAHRYIPPLPYGSHSGSNMTPIWLSVFNTESLCHGLDVCHLFTVCVTIENTGEDPGHGSEGQRKDAVFVSFCTNPSQVVNTWPSHYSLPSKLMCNSLSTLSHRCDTQRNMGNLPLLILEISPLDFCGYFAFLHGSSCPQTWSMLF